MLFGTRYTDLCYGYNAFWRDGLADAGPARHPRPAPADGRMLWGDGFEIETLINIRMATVRSARSPRCRASNAARLHGVSNLNAYKDGMRVLSTILREFRTRRPVVAPARRPVQTAPTTATPPTAPAHPALPTQRSLDARDRWHELPTVGNEPMPARNET